MLVDRFITLNQYKHRSQLTDHKLKICKIHEESPNCNVNHARQYDLKRGISCVDNQSILWGAQARRTCPIKNKLIFGIT